MASLTGSIMLTDFHTGLGINWLGELESSSSIANPKENDIYYNTTDKITYIFHKGQWQKLSAEGTGIDIYDLQFNNSEILRYIALQSGQGEGRNISLNDEYLISCYPNILSMKAIKKTDGEDEVLISNHLKEQSSYETYELYFCNTNQSEDFFAFEDILNNSDYKNEYETLDDEGEVIKKQYISYDSENHSFNIDFNALSKILVDDATPLWQAALYSAIYTAQTSTLIFKLIVGEKENSLYPIILRNPSSDELATFSVYAGGIVAAIEDKVLDFSPNGLKIFNTGFSIEIDKTTVNENNEVVEYADTVFKVVPAQDGKEAYLMVKGRIEAESGVFNGEVNATSGIFKGRVEAETGIFNGEVNATSGTFKGSVLIEPQEIQLNQPTNAIYLSIDKEKPGIFQGKKTLTQKGSDLIESYSDSNFYVDLNGHVIAKSIELDEGTIGNINFKNSTIWASNDSSKVWEINDTKAIFNNVEIKGKISTAIFEQAKSQLCGGSFLFKDGLSIQYTGAEQFKNEDISIEHDGAFKENHLYLFSNEQGEKQFYALYGVNGWDNNYTITPTKDIQYTLAIDLGEVDKSKKPLSLVDCFIGVNSSDSSAINGLNSNSITISEVTPIQNSDNSLSCQIIPRITLGKLSGELGYGLSADNVYLNGTLTTKYNEDDGKANYAGINTINEVPFVLSQGEISDNSSVIIWAGAEGTDTSSIQGSKFQVTAEGTMYAQDAIINNSILAGANITANVLRAKAIYGFDNDKAALEIYDSDKGISFYAAKDNKSLTETEKEKALVFQVDSTNITSSVPIVGSAHDNNGSFDFSGHLKTGNILLNDDGINFYNLTSSIYNINTIGNILQFSKPGTKESPAINILNFDNTGINMQSDMNIYQSQIYKYEKMVGDIKSINILATYTKAEKDKKYCGIDLFISEEK